MRWLAIGTVALALGCAGTAPSPAGPTPGEANGGYGALRSGDVFRRDQIELIDPRSMMDLLDGRFPGVQVLRTGGTPRLVIRGCADPLVLEDGIPLGDPAEIWTINPRDVEQIRILRGEEAGRYVTRGNRGVVEITTRWW